MILHAGLLLCLIEVAQPNQFLSKDEVLPWLIQLEMKSAGESKFFMGSLIAYRSIVTCCWCITPINPKVKTMHRSIQAELETVEARAALDSHFKEYQVC
ncbi:Hypothetical protein NTJ_12719 [Nesidiocoris tenuis]|uniref:Uncharacterized protein n=1 Tax=Nesidiocoris tenuis TaxID=355587 RepID=A0ABN7B8B5_9HEMI|nr:Hypothetical protein NTJ_12719 [Nesidiocoris tenuis]